MKLMEEFKKELEFKHRLRLIEKESFNKRKIELLKEKKEKLLLLAVKRGKERAEQKPIIEKLFQTCKDWLINTNKQGFQLKEGVGLKVKKLEEKKEDSYDDIFKFT